MFQRILVPLDGSPGAERAIPVAARIARFAGGSVVFLHIVSPSEFSGKTPAVPRKTLPDTEKEEHALIEASDYLATAIAAHQKDLAGVPTEMDIAFGLTSPTVSSTARLEQGDLIVMCSHREAGLGRWGIESTAQQTMHRSSVPLLILNEHGMLPLPDAAHPLHVLVPLDGSLFAEAALEAALHSIFQLAGAARSELHLLRIVEKQDSGYEEAERYLKAISDRLRKGIPAGRDFSIKSWVEVGTNVAETILEQAEEVSHAHLIVMATHSREGMQRLVLGSVAEDILGATTYPLLVVRPLSKATRAAKPGQRSVGKL